MNAGVPNSTEGIAPFLTWHDQFKTAVLANAATFGLIAADTTPITTDNTDYHAKLTNRVATGNAAAQATADLGTSRTNAEKHARALANRIKAHPAYTPALGSLLGIVGPEDSTDISTLKPKISGDYKAVFVVGDVEASQFSDEITVNCAPLV